MENDGAQLPDPVWAKNSSSINRYERNLPHWRMEGGVYFVTFRLRDSIPQSVLKAWLAERAAWLEKHGITEELNAYTREMRYREIPEGVRLAFEREETRKFFVELDKCHGECQLRDPNAATIIVEALQFFDGERLRCGDLVVMPNHVHWLVLPLPGFQLEDILQSVKSWTGRNVNALLNRKESFWQKESFDRLVRDADEFERTRAYIRENPLKARVGEGEYRYVRCDWF